jgi:hypothetical protein
VELQIGDPVLAVSDLGLRRFETNDRRVPRRGGSIELSLDVGEVGLGAIELLLRVGERGRETEEPRHEGQGNQ